MKNKIKTIDWKYYLKPDANGNSFVVPAFQSQEVLDLIRRINSEYLHWEDFKRHEPVPAGFTREQIYALAHTQRVFEKETLPLVTETRQPLGVVVTKAHLRDLSFIDSKTSGSLAGVDGLPGSDRREIFILDGLAEEAIASSQIEGASTTHRVAREMIDNKRPPRNRDEQMIFNNFLAMKELELWKNRKLDDEFLIELHALLTKDTLEKEEYEGRFRDSLDDVVVKDKLTGEIVHTPPAVGQMQRMLGELYDFANQSRKESDFIHPFVVASILHYALGYVHPFVDGNGRMARMLFYWYLIKHGYWMMQYLSISAQIKQSRIQYDRAFLYAESDENDATYFVDYKLKVAVKAYQELEKQIRRRQKKAEELLKAASVDGSLNPRQIEILSMFRRNADLALDIQRTQEIFKVVYQTARSDLLGLTKLRVLKQEKRGKKFVFIRGDGFPRT